ncbi:MAG: LytTR family DNA-binding domain-containing protein [Flavobacteriales bacterium]|nr:LytTR family DNA-binding domain-containing protein [Flavobacteriales bacterium]
MNVRTLIVDDEAPARAVLMEALRSGDLPCEVVGQADGRESAIAKMDELRPDLVLLDIHLGDGSGFDVLERAVWKGARVIFITAHDRHAIRAFRYAAVDYLLKPVDPAQLAGAVRRVQASSSVHPGVEALLRNIARPGEERIVVPCAEGVHVLDPGQVVRCEADGNYTRLHTLDGERLVTARTLKDFEELLTPHRFGRVHISHLVNLRHVRKFLNRDGGVLVLADGAEVPVSQRRRQQVLTALVGL